MRPTRIVAPPRKIKGTTRGVTFRYMVLCDDGKEYEMRELAARIGFKPGSYGLYKRISKLGWGHEQVLSPPVPKGYTLEQNNVPGNGAWERLGRNDRSYRLCDIPTGGVWELRRL